MDIDKFFLKNSCDNLELALQDETKFIRYLLCFPEYSCMMPGKSSLHFNMDAIYLYCKKNPNFNMAERINTALKIIVKDYLGAYNDIMALLTYQSICEKNNVSPFKIDIYGILMDFRNNILNIRGNLNSVIPGTSITTYDHIKSVSNNIFEANGIKKL